MTAGTLPARTARRAETVRLSRPADQSETPAPQPSRPSTRATPTGAEPPPSQQQDPPPCSPAHAGSARRQPSHVSTLGADRRRQRFRCACRRRAAASASSTDERPGPLTNSARGSPRTTADDPCTPARFHDSSRRRRLTRSQRIRVTEPPAPRTRAHRAATPPDDRAPGPSTPPATHPPAWAVPNVPTRATAPRRHAPRPLSGTPHLPPLHS